MLVAQVLAAVERLAPPALAEDWDNVGLIVGRHNQPVRRVLVALELRGEVLGEAREHSCDAVLTHHPPIFPTIRAVTDGAAGELVLRAAEDHLAVISAHTNLDACRGGLNDVMAEILGITAPAPLRPVPEMPSCGLGRIGTVRPVTLSGLVEQVTEGFGAGPVSYAGDPWTQIRRVACCTGSGAPLIDDARAAEADAFVTSDLKYHDADRAEGLPLIALPHARAERVALKRWSRVLQKAVASQGVEIRFAETDTDPWQSA